MNSRDIQKISLIYENIYHQNDAWSDLMVELEELRSDDDFELEQFIWDISDMDLYYLCPDIYSDYFGNPETYNDMVYHSTTDDNLESIELEGLRPESRTRGMSNKRVGGAIFASYEPDEMESYGDILITIDLKKARELNPKLVTGLEPPIEEYLRRSAVAGKLGIEDASIFEPSRSDGVSADTLVIYGHVPREAISIKNDSIF